MRSQLTAFLVFAFIGAASAHEFHVATTGSDANPGTKKAPFRTIQHAAELAQPGDVITVHEGVYHERISPPRGGKSDRKRITYQAAPGEQVAIKGSAAITNWVKIQNDVWQAVIPNSFFGSFNPYHDLIRGDWFEPMGREQHTGTVYLNDAPLIEATNLTEVLKPIESQPRWYAKVDATNTTLWAQFKGVNPNDQLVEINVRQTVFYPSKTGVNYLTVRGFSLSQAATPWAPPTAEQIGLIGTHWSKGWIIESNVISHSVCVGIALGKYGDEWDNRAESAEGYVGTLKRALTNGWNKATIGHHLVRNNIISHCGQAGIVGSLGCAFSTITGNVIHDINVPSQLSGWEIAGIKFHGAVDVTISHNHIYRCSRGIWLDWMAQGTRVTRNLLHDNGSSCEDLMVEVNHGPFLVDNNLFLSAISLRDWSEGGAYVHNLLAGKIYPDHPQSRLTPFHPAHSTAIAGLEMTHGADDRFYNNLFVGDGQSATTSASKPNPKNGGYGLWVYDTDPFSLQTGGNVYLNGARPGSNEVNPVVLSRIDSQLKILEENGQTYIQFNFGSEPDRASTVLITTKLLGRTKVSGQSYENADCSSLKIATDFFGKQRNKLNPTCGPFEKLGQGDFIIKIW